MQLLSILFTLAAAVSAVDLHLYTGFNCGGTDAVCGNVGAGFCCISPFGDNSAPSVAVVYTNPGTQLFGYQKTLVNPDQCGTIAKQQATGQFSFLCMSIDSSSQFYFSSTRWYPAGGRKRETCSPTSSSKCTGAVTPNKYILNDGRLFNLDDADEATRREMYGFVLNGSTVADLPEKLAVLEEFDEAEIERYTKVGA